METRDLTGIVKWEDIPVCPICGMPIDIEDMFSVAVAEGLLFLVHVECGDVDFYNA